LQVACFGVRDTGYKKGLFPINILACLRAVTHRQAICNLQPETLTWSSNEQI